MVSKDLIITLAVVSVLGAIGAAALFGANAANNAKDTQRDFSTTFVTTFEKAKANNNAEAYNLSKVIDTNSKKVYNINKRIFEKKIVGKTLSGTISGVAQFSGAGVDTLAGVTLPANVNNIGIVLATTDSLASCTAKNANGDFVSVANTILNINAKDSDACRGGVSDNAASKIVYVFKDAAEAQKINQKLFDNDAAIIKIGATPVAAGLGFKLR